MSRQKPLAISPLKATRLAILARVKHTRTTNLATGKGELIAQIFLHPFLKNPDPG